MIFENLNDGAYRVAGATTPLGVRQCAGRAGSERAAEAIAALRDGLSVVGRKVHVTEWYLASLTLAYLLVQY